MRFRKLRIAWSVGCGIACVLLVVLWVRSYSKPDYLNRQSPPWFVIESHNGQLTYMAGLPAHLLSRVAKFEQARSSTARVWGFGSSQPGKSVFLLFLPHWSVVLLTSVLAALPWIFRVRYRFSLRTLLIATTLVAAVLGLIVAVLRWPAG